MFRLVGAAAFVALALFTGLAEPFAPMLSPAGHLVLMSLIVALAIWIFKPFNLALSVGAVVMLASFLAGGIPAAVAFSGYTSSALWVLIPALFFGYALAKTGLGKRLALIVIRLFRPTYAGLTLAWVVIGLVLSMLTPSITMRVAIVTPIAVMCCDVAKLAPGSKGRALILLTALATAMAPGNAWLTGALTGPILTGMYESVPELQGVITFGTWAQASALPVLIATALTVAGGFVILRPDEPIDITKVVFDEEARKLGPWRRAEMWTAAILSAAFAMFVTGQLHRVPAAATCLFALFLLHLTGVLDFQDINRGISWDVVLFLGAALSLPAVFGATGLSTWLAGVVVPFLFPVASPPLLFAMAIVIVLFLWRFVDIATMIPTMAILVPIIPALTAQYGISPLIWIPLCSLALNAMFLSYQNVFVLVGESVAGKERWTAKQLLKYGIIYFVVCLLVVAISVPYWVALGYFSP